MGDLKRVIVQIMSCASKERKQHLNEVWSVLIYSCKTKLKPPIKYDETHCNTV